MLNQIKELTEENEHSQARILAACLLNKSDLRDEYMSILSEQERTGYLSAPNSTRRIEADKKLFKLAKNKMSPKEYSEFYHSF